MSSPATVRHRQLPHSPSATCTSTSSDCNYSFDPDNRHADFSTELKSFGSHETSSSEQTEKIPNSDTNNERENIDQTSKLPSIFDYFILGRPKFLMYSLACHVVGVLVAAQQGNRVDWVSLALLQITIWLSHLMTHYINEYGDYEADKFNTNAGSWTGGSKILQTRGIPKVKALIIGITLQVFALIAGASSVLRYVALHAGVNMAIPENFDDALAIITATMHNLPYSFVLFGLSVFFVAFAYSLPPFRLSAVGMGEVCVSYVLTLSTPVVGCLLQGGQVTVHFLLLLIPLFLFNVSRMVIMNIPDRAGDLAAGKVTSVVMLGESRAVMLTHIVNLATYLIVIPQLGLGRILTTAYLLPLPLRWWQSLRISVSHWWTRKQLVDSIPFIESIFILATVSALAAGLVCEMHEPCAAWFAT